MDLSTDLAAILDPKRVLTRPLDCVAYASDASLYRMIPQAVVQPNSIQEIQGLFAFSHAQGLPLTFRAAGTSLSGQAITNGILVDISKHWGRVQVEQDGAQVRVQPGVVGGFVNNCLKPYRRRIGPDPASIDACMIGGILANNASGMCCGVIENSYHTLEALTFVLPNGLVINSAGAGANQDFVKQAPEIAAGLLEMKRRIENDPSLVQRIRAKYRTKNTTGYSLNAFIDFDTPLDILTHLLVGSEGTLAFIAEAVLRTLPDLPYKYTGLLFFADVQSASRAIGPLKDSGAFALEIMDRAALSSIEQLDGAPASIRSLPGTAAGLLVEYQCSDRAAMEQFKQTASSVCMTLGLLYPPAFTENPVEQAGLWKLRKGMLPSVGAMRLQGTTVIIEDVAFAVDRLAEAITDLQNLFNKHHYSEAIIFGHAKDGNLHFVITPSFNNDESVLRYQRFMDDVVDLVVGKYDGALKAEHGTGRNIAPFVEREWGETAYQLMIELKALLDPDNLLNPGVIINPDRYAHVKDLKSLPVVEPEVDQCMECGFCESRCPSRNLTLTPRQRIVVWREIARLKASGSDAGLLKTLELDFPYAGVNTCAVDGLCATACPVNINTGTLVKRLRVAANSSQAQAQAVWVSHRFATVESAVRAAVATGHVIADLVGAGTIAAVTRGVEHVLHRNLPKWNRAVPHASSRRWPETKREGVQAVYFPACLSRVMGKPPLSGAEPSLIETMLTVAGRAGVTLWIPGDCVGHCCGMPFGSKGYKAAYHEILHETINKMWVWTDGGRLPVVIDASSCAYTLRTCEQELVPGDLVRWKQIKLLDSIEFIHDTLLPRLRVRQLPEAVVLHPNCAARKLNEAEKLLNIAKACTVSATIPLHLDCCGFAGDRGLLFPELTASATRLEAAEVCAGNFDGYYSSNLTCEMGISLATDKPYRSIVYLVEKACRD